MKAIKFSIVQYAIMLWCLLFAAGCERWSREGEYRVIGTATVNGEEYVDMRHRGWNRDFTQVTMSFYPHYNMFQMGFVFLQPKNLGKVVNPEYKITFCLTTENQQIQTNLPYKIEYNGALESDDPFSKEVLNTLVFDKSKIISPDVNNGVAIVGNYKTKETHSMEGYIIIRHLDFQNDYCKGEYMLKTPAVSGKEELIINGMFEAEPFKSNFHFLNK